MPTQETWMHVAEKPSVAKEISRLLSDGRARCIKSASPFNPVFEFEMQGKTWLFTSVTGHLMEVEFPPETKSWQTFPFVELFRANITKKIKKENKPLERNLQDLARRSHRLVLWLDCDREGENIAFEVINVVREVKNKDFPVSRARFSGLTQRDLERAVSTLGIPDEKASDAVDARQEMDLRIGAVFTRFQTVLFGDHFEGMPTPLSFGPCQIPCLGFVVQRHWEREAFIPEKFYNVTLVDRAANAPVTFKWSRGNIYDAQSAAVVAAEMSDTAAAEEFKATVKRVERIQKKRCAPHPLATVQLQKLVSQHLHISSERCMHYAEALYQEGFISYPRTETDSYTYTDEELKELASLQAESQSWGAFAYRVATDPLAFRRPSSGGHNDNAHPPIHPLKHFSMLAGADDKAKIYELIARHFLASLSPDAEAADTQVTVVYGGESFHAGGHTIVARNWLEVFPYESWNDKTVPNYDIDNVFYPTDVTVHEGLTEPPPPLNEAHLITMMDEFGIGTDATIAEHIKTIQKRAYVTATSGVFTPTPLGIALLAAYERIGMGELFRPQRRAQMEAAMADIAHGRARKDTVVQSAIGMYREIFLCVFRKHDDMLSVLRQHLAPRILVDEPVVDHSFVVCGQCENRMILTRAAGGPPKAVCRRCSIALRLPSKGQLSAHELRCRLCNFGVVRVHNAENGREHTVCVKCFSSPPLSSDIEATAVGEFRCFNCTCSECPLSSGTADVVGPCPVCGNELRLRRVNGQTSYGILCRGYPRCSFAAYLPPCAAASLSDARCTSCPAKKISFRFSTVQTPPAMDQEETVCVFCDRRLFDLVKSRGQRAVNALPTANAKSAYTMPQLLQVSSRGIPRGQQCLCGVPAAQKKSRKPQSEGRSFLTCGKYGTCHFFQWLD